MNLLIVEDEQKVLQFLKGALSSEGYRVETAASYREFQEYIEAATYLPEVIIMDRMLDGYDSLALIVNVRLVFPGARILVLSAINAYQERAAALDKGADDYMGKPFSLLELSARIRALARRAAPAVESCLRIKDLTLDLLTRTASAGSTRLDLSNKEFQLLSLLMKSPGRVYNKFQLLDQIWELQAHFESNVVEVTIKNLRAKLAEANCQVLIQNRRNVGYWIEN